MATRRDNIEGIYRLTPTQEGILFHVLGAPDQGLYFQQFTCLLDGPLDEERFAAAWQAALQRHPGARALFTWEGRKNPLQVVRRDVRIPVSFVDAPELAAPDAWERFLAEDRARGFDLSQAPLMRVVVVRGDGDRVRLLWSFHHLLLDGWSMRLFLADVFAAWAGRALPPVSSRFEDYVAWLGRQDQAAARSFWQRELAGFSEPVELGLPAAGPGATTDLAPGEQAVRLSEAATQALTSWARRERVTLNTVLRGCWALLQARYTGREDVVFGATVSGRATGPVGVEEIVGMCINTLPVRVAVEEDAAPGAWLRGIQEQQRAGEAYQWVALVDLQRWSDVPPGRGLFDAVLVFENLAVGSADEPTALVAREQRFIERSNYPLALLVLPGRELSLTLVFDRAKLAASGVARLARHLESILIGFADDAPSVAAVPMLSAEDRADLLAFHRSATGAPNAAATTVLERMREAAVRTPAAIAVRDPDEALTYAELWAAATGLAGGLRRQGLTPGDHALLLLDRSVAMVVGILGVLLAEGAYVPLDPDWPADRIGWVQGDTGARVVLASPGRVEAAAAALASAGRPEVPVVPVSGPWPAPGADCAPCPALSAEARAYVLYTSGSTGRPKGVAVRHGNLWQSTAARFGFYHESLESFLLLSPYHFDSSVAGLFWTLCAGGTLALPPVGGERDVAALLATIERERITHTLCLPSLWEPLLGMAPAGALASLRVVVVAGEACPGSLVLQHRAKVPECALVNEYGPTEATVWATAHRLEAADARGGVPIGRPVGATEVFVLNARGEPTPPEIPGEIYLGGPGLAWGYVADPERTAERFVEKDLLGLDPRRLYRTGDLGRFRPDGTLDFLGRSDHQVKIRGHRIEIGEIEAALRTCPGVAEAVVVARRPDRARPASLVAYLVAAPGAASATEPVRAHLARVLPDPMVPRAWVWLDEVPRTGTGKVDRGALPDPERQAEETGARVAPRSSVEAQLLPIWCEVLGLDGISVDANLFELGGDSLLSIRIIARAHQLGIQVDPVRFASRPTIAGMAAAVRETSDRDVVATRGPATADGWLPLTPVQRWFFAQDLPRAGHWNQAARFPVPPGLREDAVQAVLVALRNTHDALRLRFARRDGVWMQRVAPADAQPVRVDTVDLSAVPTTDRSAAFEASAADLHKSLDLQSGPLLAAGFYRQQAPLAGAAGHASGDGELLLVVHHLAVDAVSWQTIAEDLEAGWVQASAGGAVRLTPPPASFADWVGALQDYSRSPACLGEKDFWAGVAAAAGPPLPVDFPAAANPVADEVRHRTALSPELTQVLLHDASAAYKTRILDLLLAALVRSLASWNGGPRLFVDLERHGREPHVSALDVTRTVGWFTAVHPIALATTVGSGPGDAIKQTKELLRAIPGGGIGAGLVGAWDGRRPELLFNYLGRQDGAGGGYGAHANLGPCRDTGGRRAYLLEINAAVVGDALEVTWTFGSGVHRRETVEALAAAYLQALTELIEHCRDPSSGGVTPSDFPMAGLDQAGLDMLGDLLDED